MVKIIGISGGSGSGKTTIVNKISEVISEFVLISQDNYYKSVGDYEYEFLDVNFDHPDAFDNNLFYKQLKKLKENQSINMPLYDFINHKRRDETIKIVPTPIIIVEGIMIFVEERVRNLIDLKIYIDTPNDIRFIRRLERDMSKRGRTLESVIEQYLRTTRAGYYRFIEPTKEYADLIIPEGGHNDKALYVLSSFLKTLVKDSSKFF
ncbi:Uridine kinase [Borrelia duttonii CR2A]|uniref:Uridine kinase n=5 Tax=Borrelia TaxID=138 RepID=URK_BORDL|nr:MULTISPECIES: uridine kinase [Borrelia]B5RLM3.1 RecName: Full=Uridine kinase; AltName: Full=Cytidine monophosphokinase; AltName: Full=Uridine monophosphokinase [Borrelia duttonii Ly]B5RQJ8.1 RecName: Full=Uridine kinase; AltName: Full=Cytidine monophosphokinase; AltName: Full=Uridine monophosphokinase [Borrelia recurrentis A1]ACH92979.1 uridine kinase [Borrelia duttonii Ly]ACH94282.1 uridine kinase [Borrelia recurrentis A1]AFI30800.1 Uridine kinase [Borrelia crocidurae str. Achema]AHH06084